MAGVSVMEGILNRQSHLSFGGELDRVSDQVQEDLLELASVAVDPILHLWMNEGIEFDVFLGASFTKGSEDVVDQFPQAERFVVEILPPRFDLGEVKNVIDDGKERPGTGANGFEKTKLLRAQVRLEEELGHPHDGVHGRSDLVTDRGQEFTFQSAVFLGLRFCDLEGALRVLASGDIRFDGDEIGNLMVCIANRLNLDLNPMRDVRFVVVENLYLEGVALIELFSHELDRFGVRLFSLEQGAGLFALDLIEGVSCLFGEPLVHPFGEAGGIGDDDGVVRLGGDEGQFLGFRCLVP